MPSKQGVRGGLHVMTVLCCKFLSGAAMETLVELYVGHPHAVQRAEFALRELQGLSDTGIFRALSLHNIAAASTQDGAFHFNTHLTLDLASPYFSSGRKEERFEVVIMEHKEDGHASFSIDSFPDMDPEAMEHFYIQKVEHHRQARTVFFSTIDSQTEGDDRALELAGTSDPGRLAASMMEYAPHQLLALLAEGGQSTEDPIRQAVGVEVLRRLEERTM